MTAFEYRMEGVTITDGSSVPDTVQRTRTAWLELLNALGAEGWELTGYTQQSSNHSGSTGHYAWFDGTFKRAIEGSATT